ncbi:hypothetical protein D3C84_346830 [compost metagenome]
MGLARRIEIVASQGQVAGLQIGLAYLELEVGDAGAVVALVQQIQGIEEVDQRHVHLPLIPVEAGEHDQGVAEQGGVAEGMEVVGRLVGILQRLLRLLLRLIEADHLVRQQTEEQGILQILGLLLGIDILPEGELGLPERLIEVPSHGADPGPGQGILGLLRPLTRLGQLALGQIELPPLHAGVDVQQAAVDLQLALFEARIGQQFVKLFERHRAGARGMLLHLPAADLEVETMGLQLELLLLLGHGDALVEGLLGGFGLTQLLQALTLKQVGPRGLGRSAIAQDRLPIAVLLTVADDLLGVIGRAFEEGGGNLDTSGGIAQHQGLCLLQIDRQLLLGQIQIRSRQGGHHHCQKKQLIHWIKNGTEVQACYPSPPPPVQSSLLTWVMGLIPRLVAPGLLADEAQVGGHGFPVTAEGVDVQAPAAGIAGIDGQLLRGAEVLEIDEDALDALLVELVVLAEGDEIAQQLLPIEARAAVVDHQGSPVRLAGDQAVGLEQMAVQCLLHYVRLCGPLQQGLVKLVAVDLDVLLVDALARQQRYLVRGLIEGEQGDAHLSPGTGAQVFGQQCLHRRQGVAAGLVEGVEVELERLGFDEVRAGGGHGHFAERDHGLALGVEPGEFIQGPDVAALEGQRFAKAEIVAVQTAWHGLQQGRGVLADVGRLLPQAQALQRAGACVSLLFAHACLLTLV